MNLSHRRGISTTIAVAVIVVVIVAAGGVGYYYYTTQTATSTGESVTLGFAGVPDVTDTPGFMLWQTFASQLGLTVHVQYYDGDTTVADALIAGNIQVGEGGFQAVLQADEVEGNASGSYPFVVFGTYEASNDFGLLVNNSIQSFSDLAGKPVAVSSSGSTSDIFCHLLESSNGLSPSQIDCAYYHGTPSRYAALLAGNVVGDITEPFYMVDAVETGRFHILATVPSVEPNLLFSTLYTSRTFAAAHPDIVQKLEDATILADRWAHNETLWIQKEQEEFPGTNTTIAGAAWKIWMAMNIWAPDGGLSQATLNYSTNFYVGLGKVNSYVAPKFWSTLQYQNQSLTTYGKYSTCPDLKGCPDPSIPNLPFSIPGVSSAILPWLNSGFMTGGGFLAIQGDSTAVWGVGS
jgi:ABC-type nitrate/sulfonate/bicarbonate transport system substrate-binding protein